MDAMEAILTRRSTRRYAEVMPDRELIGKVIEAGRFAPSGGNNQTTHFIVFTDKAVLAEMAELVCHEFSKMEVGENTYASLRNSINASKKGGYVFHYNAPVLIVTANQKDYGLTMEDLINNYVERVKRINPITPENAEYYFINDYATAETFDNGTQPQYAVGRLLCTYLNDTYGENFLTNILDATNEIGFSKLYIRQNPNMSELRKYAEMFKNLFGENVFSEFGAWFQDIWAEKYSPVN